MTQIASRPERPWYAGPWTTRPTGKGTDEVTWIGTDVANYACVPGYVDHPGNKAVAVLCAASPDVFEMLVAAMHALRSYQFGNESRELAKKVADAAEATIQKTLADAKAGS